MRACESFVIVGSALTTSMYWSSVPLHALDSRAARSSLMTRSKVSISAIGQTPWLLALRRRLPEGEGQGKLGCAIFQPHSAPKYNGPPIMQQVDLGLRR